LRQIGSCESGIQRKSCEIFLQNSTRSPDAAEIADCTDKIHSDPIRNDEALDFFEKCASTKRIRKKTKISSDIG